MLALGPHFENQGLWAGTPTPGMGRGGGVGEEQWIAGHRLQAQRWVMAGKLGSQTGSEVGSGTSTSLRAFLFQVSVTLRVQVTKWA